MEWELGFCVLVRVLGVFVGYFVRVLVGVLRLGYFRGVNGYRVKVRGDFGVVGGWVCV